MTAAMNPMQSGPRLVLASASAIRAKLLANAGFAFDIVRPGVDESLIKARMSGADPEEIAAALADAKALAVTAPGALVIGSDQVMEFEGRIYDKPATRSEAAARLAALAGQTHSLINAVSVAANGAILFRTMARPRLTMRALTRLDIDAYLERAGDEALSSVGAYQLESLGAHLFEAVEGDYFAVLGLNLLPLIGFLRSAGVRAF